MEARSPSLIGRIVVRRAASSAQPILQRERRTNSGYVQLRVTCAHLRTENQANAHLTSHRKVGIHIQRFGHQRILPARRRNKETASTFILRTIQSPRENSKNIQDLNQGQVHNSFNRPSQTCLPTERKFTSLYKITKHRRHYRAHYQIRTACKVSRLLSPVATVSAGE